MLYWKGLSKDVKIWVRECSIFQQFKNDNVAYPELLQPHLIPGKAWSGISIEFVKGLPLSKGKSTILVVVDRLTKHGHFISLAHPYIATAVA